MIKSFLLGLVLALVALQSSAQQQATPVNGDTRLVTFNYDPDQTYLILTRPKVVTHVQLAADERVKLAVAGDTASFNVVVSADRANVLIRPKYEGMTTSLTLITNKHSYPVMLRSTSEESGKWYQRVTWNFGDMAIDEIAAQESRTDPPPASRKTVAQSTPVLTETVRGNALQLDRLGMNYQVEGSDDIKPAYVLDDGIKTYIKFSDQLQTLPAIFGLQGDDSVIVNYTFDGGHVVIQGLYDGLVLKLGKRQVKVTKGGKHSSWLGSFGG